MSTRRQNFTGSDVRLSSKRQSVGKNDNRNSFDRLRNTRDRSMKKFSNYNSNLDENKLEIVSFFDGEQRPRLSGLYDSKNTNRYLDQVFQIKESLAGGTFSFVHKAIKRDDNKVYAIKELVHFIQNKSDEKQKRREVYINEILGHHPNIVRLICAWRENCVLYMQFEWCPYSLHDILKRQHEIEDPDIYYYLIDILKGVEYVHSCGYIHADIKPENILVSSDYICKLGDFGICVENVLNGPKAMFDLGYKPDQEGDAKYLAKEVLRSGPSQPGDIFSVGITLLEMATDLDLPNDGEKWNAIRKKILDEKFLNLMSPDIKRLVELMIEKDPNLRPTATEILQDPALQKYLRKRELKVQQHLMKFKKHSTESGVLVRSWEVVKKSFYLLYSFIKNYFYFILYFNKTKAGKDNNDSPSTPNMNQMNLAAFYFSRSTLTPQDLLQRSCRKSLLSSKRYESPPKIRSNLRKQMRSPSFIKPLVFDESPDRLSSELEKPIITPPPCKKANIEKEMPIAEPSPAVVPSRRRQRPDDDMCALLLGNKKKLK